MSNRYLICFLQFRAGGVSSNSDYRDVKRIVFASGPNLCFIVFTFIIHFPLRNRMEEVTNSISISMRPILATMNGLIRSMNCLFRMKIIIVSGSNDFFPHPRVIMRLSFNLSSSFGETRSLRVNFSCINGSPMIEFNCLCRLLSISQITNARFRRNGIIFETRTGRNRKGASIVIRVSRNVRRIIDLQGCNKRRFLNDDLSIYAHGTSSKYARLPAIMVNGLLRNFRTIFRRSMSYVTFENVNFFIRCNVDASTFRHPNNGNVSIRQLTFRHGRWETLKTIATIDDSANTY